MTLFALISGWNFMILWFEVIITRENSFTKGQWNKGKKALFFMILISFFFSLSVLCLSLILCPLWISFDHGSWDWSCFSGVPIFNSFRSTEIEYVQRVITSSLHRWLKFITLLDFDSIIAKFFYIARSNWLKIKFWLLTVYNHVVLGRGEGGWGAQPSRNCEIALERWAFNRTLQPCSRLL